METNFFTERNPALNYLLDKYNVTQSGRFTDVGCFEIANKPIVLLPWRVERRFIELKKMIDDNTLEDISTFRFAHLAPAEDKTLDQLIYQELDLCEWLGGATVKKLFGVFHGSSAVNIIAQLTNGLSCSVECSVMLPKGATVIHRHEIIARRGVASDQAIDTQVAQSSIYTYTVANEQRFTDIDAEIFGLSPSDINLVRAGFKILDEPETASAWATQDKHLLNLIKNVKQSETANKISIIEGDEQV